MTQGLIPSLPRRAWVIVGGSILSDLGSGLTKPFVVVYLNQVRDIPLTSAALTISVIAAVAVAGSPIGGALVDRLGSKRAVIVSLVLWATGTLGFAAVREVWHAFAAGAFLGAGLALFWPGITSLLSTAVTREQRSSVFALHYAAINAGLGVGGVLGGFLTDISSPRSFQILFVVDAATFLLFAIVLLRVRDIPAPASEAERGQGLSQARGGYRELLRDRLFLRVWLLMVVLSTIGYGQLESGFPAFATIEGGIGTTVLGLAFGANTAVIVAAQLFILRWTRGIKRTSAVQWLCGLWALAWTATVVAGSLSGSSAATGFILAMALFGLGETLLSPSIPAIINDLAPDRLRGRYNAAYTLAWSAGEIVGPAAAGVLIAAGLGQPFFGGLVVACGFAAVYASRLGRKLPLETNTVTADRAA